VRQNYFVYILHAFYPRDGMSAKICFNLVSCETVRSKRFIVIVEFAFATDFAPGLASRKNIPRIGQTSPAKMSWSRAGSIQVL